MRKAWFSASEIAREKLPGLPGSQQGIAKIIERERWDSGDLARPRQGRGGGLEYHFSLFPASAQAALVTKYAEAYGQPNERKSPAEKPLKLAAEFEPESSAGAWARYEALPAALKDKAAARLRAIMQVDELRRHIGRGPAMRATAREQGIALATLNNWFHLVRGVPRADWLPALLPARRGGRGTRLQVAEPVWDAIRADYLRLEQPSFSSCYHRVRRLAARHGWEMPPERTLRRRIDEIPEAVVTMARQGRDATKALYPAQQRSRAMFNALQCVNVDGHKWDVFVRWEDGTVSRPMMVAFQDLYSNLFLAWRLAKSENKDAVRLCLGDLVTTYGIPEHCWLDNGRAFAAKWLTGGTPNRYRFKVKAEEPDGILTQLGVQIHWTTPYAGQSKPIERGFGDFARDIAKHPQFAGAYAGNSPMAKPENYGSRAVPIDVFREVIDREIAAHNAREGRDTEVCGGKKSFLQAFEESYSRSIIRQATPEQARMFMLAAEGVRVRRDGAIYLLDNRYWCAELLEHRGRLLTVRFDPENVHQDLAVYAQDGRLLCIAQLVEAVGFADTTAAREHAAARNAYLRATKEQLAAQRKMSLAELVALQGRAEGQPTTPIPAPKIVRPIFDGNAARKTTLAAEEEQDVIYENLARGLRLVRPARELPPD